MNRVMQTVVIAIALGAMAAAQAAPPAPPVAPVAPVTPKPSKAPRAPVAAAPAAKSYAYLGVDIREVTPERASALKLKKPRGIEITLVDRDAPAGKAGLKEHDVILSFNGRNLQSGEELRKLIRETPPGRTVDLGISRDGQPMTVKAQLADKHSVVVIKRYKVRIPRVEVPIIATFSRRHGVVVENLTPQLGEAFGVKNGEGVLVRSVEKGSAGEAAGLRAGDVIVRVGGEPVEATSDWNRAMREQKPGPVQIGIVRDKRPQSLSLSVPERSAERSSTSSFRDEDFPDIDLNLDMEGYARELNQIQPEIDRAMRETQEKIRREVERSRREAERARRQAQRDLEQTQRDADRAREQALRDAQRAQEQAQRDVEQAQRDLEQAQREAERQQQPETPPSPPPPQSAPPPPPN